MFRGSVKSAGYSHHSSVSSSIPLPCVTVCHHISTGLYTLQECVFLMRTTGLPAHIARHRRTTGNHLVDVTCQLIPHNQYINSCSSVYMNHPVFPSIYAYFIQMPFPSCVPTYLLLLHGAKSFLRS